MEVALQDIQSASLEKPSVQIVLKKLEAVIEDAKEARDGAVYQNTALRRGLEIVQEFLRKTHRICYGGMAINAWLPEAQKFYDFSKTLPDYDFFTPSQDEDIRRLVKALRKEGLPNVEVKFGIHKGTTKIFVDYNSIADITAVTPSFYSVLMKDTIVENGIHYAGVNFLRMAMYLELSRPMGEVERWDKVYKRLYLLNNAVPAKTTGCDKHKLNALTSAERKILLKYIVQNSLIYCTPDLQGIYKNPDKADGSSWLTKSRGPVIVYSENPYTDAKAMKSMLDVLPNRQGLRIYRWEPEDEFIPRLIGIVENGAVLCLLVEQSACHGYNTIELKDGFILRIASLDTLIALYYSLDFVHGLRGLSRTGFGCLANTFVTISHRTRDKAQSGRFPEFSLTCTGHQPSKETLLKAKKIRIEEFREERKKKKKSMTRKLERNH